MMQNYLAKYDLFADVTFLLSNARQVSLCAQGLKTQVQQINEINSFKLSL